MKPDRTGEDLLFQVLLDWGLELTMPIAVEKLEGHEVFVVEDGALVACFDERRRARARACHREARAAACGLPRLGFASDDARINAEQVFKELSPATDVKAI